MDPFVRCDHRPTTGCEHCLAVSREEHRRYSWLMSNIREKHDEKSKRAHRICSLDPTQVEQHQKEIYGDWNWEEATRGHRSPPTPPLAPEETVNGLELPKTSSPLRELPPPEAGTVTETVEGWPVVRANASAPRRSSCDGQTSTTPDLQAAQVSDGDTIKNSGLDLDKINNTLRNLRMNGDGISRKSSTAPLPIDSSTPRTMYHKTAAGPSERRRELNSYRYRTIVPYSVSGVSPYRKPELESISKDQHESQKNSPGVVHLSIRERTNEDAETTFEVHHAAQMDSAIELYAGVSTKEDNDEQPRRDDYNTFRAD